MRLRISVSGDVASTTATLREGLQKAGFIFVETDRSYRVTLDAGRPAKLLTESIFWARKQLADPYPQTHSIEIEGEIALQGSGASIEAAFHEFHDRRKHALGGSHALETCMDEFCRIALSRRTEV